MPNFWALPPEINSTRIYLGPGSGRYWPPPRDGTLWPVSWKRRRWGCSQRSTRCWSRIGSVVAGFDTADLAVCAVADHDRRARP